MSGTDAETWAYLLRLPVGSGAIALKQPYQEICRNGKNYFSIQKRMFGNPKVTDLCGMCCINGKRIEEDASIQHGCSISVPVEGKEYVFVDCDLSNKVLQPISLNETYVLGQMLGEGGYGEVYLCFEKKSTSPLALKIAKNGSDREKNILKSLNHINVINTLFFAQVGKMTYIGMEYMAGGDLSPFMRQGRVLLSENQTKFIFYQIADAVNYLHSMGVCHRDLKPANILLHRAQPRTLIKVTDLGLSKSEILHSPPNTVAGTKCFMAPEILQGKYTKKVDVWSLGVILYMSLTGSYARICGNDVPLSELAPNRLVTKLIKKMLQISPNQRASITDVMQHEWLQDEGVKNQIAVLRAECQNIPTKLFNVNPVSEELKQDEIEGLSVFQKISIFAGGILILAIVLL